MPIQSKRLNRDRNNVRFLLVTVSVSHMYKVHDWPVALCSKTRCYVYLY